MVIPRSLATYRACMLVWRWGNLKTGNQDEKAGWNQDESWRRNQDGPGLSPSGGDEGLAGVEGVSGAAGGVSAAGGMRDRISDEDGERAEVGAVQCARAGVGGAARSGVAASGGRADGAGAAVAESMSRREAAVEGVGAAEVQVGDRVWLTRLGQRKVTRKLSRLGIVVAIGRRQGRAYVRVLWDGLRRPQSWDPEFLEPACGCRYSVIRGQPATLRGRLAIGQRTRFCPEHPRKPGGP